jgi:hypothetical protein
MRKIYRTLTKDQLTRNVIFSSALSISKEGDDDCIIHEVLDNDTDRDDTIRRLKDDSFFNRSPYNYNIIRQ